MSKLLLAAIMAAAVAAPAMAQTSTTQRDQPTTRLYDSRGNATGTASTDSQGTTTFRDSRGNVTGSTTRPAATDDDVLLSTTTQPSAKREPAISPQHPRSDGMPVEPPKDSRWYYLPGSPSFPGKKTK
jgi:hypothetical protein